MTKPLKINHLGGISWYKTGEYTKFSKGVFAKVLIDQCSLFRSKKWF